MSVPASAQALAPATADDRAVPANARRLAARLSAPFQRDMEIVQRLNDAHHRLASANEQLDAGLAPDAFGLRNRDAAPVAITTGPIVALVRDGRPAANNRTLDTPPLQHLHRQIHHAFCAYQAASEQRRQLAIEVGEYSQQLTDTLCAAGWNATQARQANVHELADAAA